ncbi:MAG: paraquat-inducible protein A [Gemmatimonadaceae bacterium]|nr:paraquat-inducible protein A [Gemmatimonadaceae bacterium]
MSTRNIAAVVLTVVSLALLWPGLTQPVLSISATITLLGQSREVFRQTQSIVESVRNLHNSGNDFVAGLILLFSITVPAIKALLLLAVFTMRNQATRRRLHAVVNSVSKWAMADVFAVAVFIAFLAARATDNLHATAERGFYFFAAYCLMSNLAFQLLETPREVEAATR